MDALKNLIHARRQLETKVIDMDQIDYNAINERLRRFNNELEMLRNSCNDEKISIYLKGCINGNNFCRTFIHGYVTVNPDVKREERSG